MLLRPSGVLEWRGLRRCVALVTHSHPSGRLPLPGPEVPPGVGGSWGLAVLALAVLVCLWPRAEAPRRVGAVPRQASVGLLGRLSRHCRTDLCSVSVQGLGLKGASCLSLGRGCSPYPSHRSGGSLHGLGQSGKYCPCLSAMTGALLQTGKVSGEHTGWVSAAAPGTGTWGGGHVLLPGTGPCSACRDVRSSFLSCPDGVTATSSSRGAAGVSLCVRPQGSAPA